MNESSSFQWPEHGPLDVEQIKNLIPHRHPFLLIDRVLDWDIENDRVLRAVKNVTYNEPFFPGHFPGNAVMPGVIMIEAMAQAAGVLGTLVDGFAGGLLYLAKIEEARFMQTVRPGDQLVLFARETRRKRRIGKYECHAEVDGKAVASCNLVCAGG
ncbi:MAG: 3-hydroxyacyl-ACP dehydratase FabZ [Pseudomonadota bacterium]